jgi:hypothetical protein
MLSFAKKCSILCNPHARKIQFSATLLYFSDGLKGDCLIFFLPLGRTFAPNGNPVSDQFALATHRMSERLRAVISCQLKAKNWKLETVL